MSTYATVDAQREPVRLSYSLRLMGRLGHITLVAEHPGAGRALTQQEARRFLPELHPLDVAVVRELAAGAVFGRIGDAVLARLLPLLCQRRTDVEGEALRVHDTPLYPRVEVEAGLVGNLRMTLLLVDSRGRHLSLHEGRLVAGSQAFFLRGASVWPIECKTPWELTGWAVTPSVDLEAQLGPGRRDQLVRDLVRLGVPEADLQRLAVVRGPPDAFAVRFLPSEDEAMAFVVLEAVYRDQRVPITTQNATPLHILGAEANGGGLIERDAQAEGDARAQLCALGFRFERQRGCYMAYGDTALAALDSASSFFPPHWRVERLANGPQFRQDLEVSASVHMDARQGMLEVSLALEQGRRDAQTIEALVGMRDLLKWLHSGQRYLRLNDGTYVAPSPRTRQSLSLLDDLGVTEQRALISPLCVGLLRKLGDMNALAVADDATRKLLDELDASAEIQPADVPVHLRDVLRDYQRRGVDWLHLLHRHRLTGILADDMGLGKTLQALALLLMVKRDEGPAPSLVVAPTSVVSVWRDEAARFAPDLSLALLHGPQDVRQSLDLTKADLVVTSYGVLRRDIGRLAEVPFRYVILDEAQSAKNASTQNAKAVRLLMSERRLALTGTPIENHPDELWAVFDFLAPAFLGNLRRFRKRYGRPIVQGDEDARHLLQARVQPLILRRMKEEVAKELPPKIEQVVRCDMHPHQRALYEHVAGELRESVARKIEKIGIERAQLDVLAALTRLRQICCDPALLPGPDAAGRPPSAKLELFEEILREALASGRRVVVFSQFVKMQDRLIDVIRRQGVEPLWLHGGTQKRDRVVAAFQDESGPPVIVVSLKAGGVGVTLTRADTVIHYDPWWNPAVERQATDRTHRLGQRRQVTVYKLVCSRSIEERVLDLAARKDSLAQALLGSEGGARAKRITREDVLALLG